MKEMLMEPLLCHVLFCFSVSPSACVIAITAMSIAITRAWSVMEERRRAKPRKPNDQAHATGTNTPKSDDT
jgi:hypothetical protein